MPSTLLPPNSTFHAYCDYSYPICCARNQCCPIWLSSSVCKPPPSYPYHTPITPLSYPCHTSIIPPSYPLCTPVIPPSPPPIPRVLWRNSCACHSCYGSAPQHWSHAVRFQPLGACKCMSVVCPEPGYPFVPHHGMRSPLTSYPALPCLSLSRPALPCLSLSRPALPCPALPPCTPHPPSFHPSWQCSVRRL